MNLLDVIDFIVGVAVGVSFSISTLVVYVLITRNRK